MCMSVCVCMCACMCMYVCVRVCVLIFFCKATVTEQTAQCRGHEVGVQCELQAGEGLASVGQLAAVFSKEMARQAKDCDQLRSLLVLQHQVEHLKRQMYSQIACYTQ